MLVPFVFPSRDAKMLSFMVILILSRQNKALDCGLAACHKPRPWPNKPTISLLDIDSWSVNIDFLRCLLFFVDFVKMPHGHF